MDPKDEIFEIFRDESKDHLNRIHRFLEEWEKKPQNLPDMQDVLRTAHTIKGDARMVGLEEIADISHTLEDLLKGVRDGGITDYPKVISFLWRLLFLLETWIFEPHPQLKKEWEETKIQVNQTFFNIQKTEKGSPHKSKDLLKKLSSVIKKPIEDSKKEELHPIQDKNTEDKKPNISPQEEPPLLEAIEEKTWELRQKKEEFLRIPSLSLDEILNLLGELTINREKITSLYYRMWNLLLPFLQDTKSQWEEKEKRDLKDMLENLYEEIGEYYNLSTELQNHILEVRMLPLSTLFQDYPRMVKKLAFELGKKVAFHMEGGETLLDKHLLESIRPAITHLIRNSVDHGIEKPSERRMLGKEEEGRVLVKAYPKGNHVFIEVEDDGRGIGEELIRQKALEKNLLSSEKLAMLSREELLNLIFTPGFSTKEKISQISGRGIGMDVVHHTVDELKGHITVETEPGQYTRFIIQLPMTLTIMQALLVQVEHQIIALPLSFVQETQMIRSDQIQREGGVHVFCLRGEYVPIFHLSTILGISTKKNQGDKYLVAILKFKKERLAVIIDKLLREQEIVVKQLGDFLDNHPLVSGATILRKGDPAIILNVYDVFQHLFFQNLKEESIEPISAKKPCILVVDDSLTVRTVQKSVLEKAGYEVITAASGKEALEKIQNQSFDLVITDIQMEPINGFELTQTLRQDPEFKDIPIIIISSLAREEERQKGLEVGANAYIVKSGYNQNELLERVELFIGEGHP